MVYHNVEDIDVEKINARIKDAIKEWGSQDDFFEGIPYSKQAFHKCVREKSLVSLSVLLEIAKKLDCDMGYLLCEYDEKRRIVADVKEATGLEPDVIDIILNMKDSFLKLSILNDLLKDNYFLAMINLLYMVDYHYEKGMELDRIEKKVESDYKNAETLEEKEKLEKRYNEYRAEHKLHDSNALANRYRLTVAFSRLLDKRYKALPDIDINDSESNWKQTNPKFKHPALF
ncbi:helix-turn-helix domain-containing protein [Acetatifactor aquisgranensis]|uniref:helix-turn-helix domain-containing protein n=1 Tax=Acetatifactor aquisgranensis TaxID=2941233 RepID=UPI00203D6B87|nr:hypothetical protein [Acetatifactor aquisgranensis]